MKLIVETQFQQRPPPPSSQALIPMSQYNRIALANLRINEDPITQEEVTEILDEIDDCFPKHDNKEVEGNYEKIRLQLLANMARSASPHVKEWLRSQGLRIESW